MCVKVKEEVFTLIGDEEAIDQNILNKMTYTLAFIKETLRFATPAPAPAPRIALEDNKIKFLSIKKGTMVVPGKLI